MNKKDSNGKKQGYWEEHNLGTYIYKGVYNNNRKHGLWKRYSIFTNTLKTKLFYVDGLMVSDVGFYYDNNRTLTHLDYCADFKLPFHKEELYV